MPGRHSSGPLGGGGSGGGGSFGGGGGFRGGGFGGPGWGWRPRGPWFRPRPMYPLWGGWGGGWGGGWMPWLFGPRFGGGGGCGGCGCLLILGLGILFVCLSGGFMGIGGRDYGYRYNPVGGYNPVVPGNNQGGASLANEPPAIQTQTAVDLVELHTAFDSRIPEWQSQLANNENKSIPPADAGLTQDNNTKEVLYGKCGSGFYLFVVENTKPDTGPADGEGYAYTTASSPAACHPPHWAVYDSEPVGGNWYFTTLKSQ